MSEGNEKESADGPVTDAGDESRVGDEAPAGDAVAAGNASRARRSGILSSTTFRIGLASVVIASAIVAFFWWQSRSSLAALAAEDNELREDLAGALEVVAQLEAELASFEAEATANATRLDNNEARLTTIGDDVGALPPELRDLERRIDALQGGRLDARDIWLREQAEYYLVLANTELALGRRIETAIEALELADTVLRQLGDPDLTRVRSAVSSELQALRAVEQPDMQRLAGDLAGLGARAFELPMRAQAPENFEAPTAVAGEDGEPGLGRLWSRTQGAMRSIVRVERQEEPVGQLLTESERRIVRRQLMLELTLARTALLDGRQEDFRASLVAADDILNREFNRESQSIVAARELLASMMRVELRPPLPSIGDSLSLLRSAPGVE